MNSVYNKERKNIEKNYEGDQFNEEYVRYLCGRYCLKYHLAMGCLFVSTATGSWRILYEKNIVKGVYHQNTKYEKTPGRSRRFEQGYHDQSLNYNSLEDVLKYIRVHDNATYYAHSKRCRNLDVLFHQISSY